MDKLTIKNDIDRYISKERVFTEKDRLQILRRIRNGENERSSNNMILPKTLSFIGIGALTAVIIGIAGTQINLTEGNKSGSTKNQTEVVEKDPNSPEENKPEEPAAENPIVEEDTTQEETTEQPDTTQEETAEQPDTTQEETKEQSDTTQYTKEQPINKNDITLDMVKKIQIGMSPEEVMSLLGKQFVDVDTSTQFAKEHFWRYDVGAIENYEYTLPTDDDKMSSDKEGLKNGIVKMQVFIDWSLEDRVLGAIAVQFEPNKGVYSIYYRLSDGTEKIEEHK